jgi:hypothetical protein
VLVALLVAACDASFENAPRVTPASESLWILVGLQMDLDGLRSYLVAHPGKSINPERIDALTGRVLATCELLTSGTLSDDELRAARYRVDLIAVARWLIQADVLASAGAIGGSTHAATMQGLGWIQNGFERGRGAERGGTCYFNAFGGDLGGRGRGPCVGGSCTSDSCSAGLANPVEWHCGAWRSSVNPGAGYALPA